MKDRVIFLSAGEPSGDFLGSQLMKAFKQEFGNTVTFAGVGGPLMAAEGLSSLFPIEELAIMGLAEVIPHIRRIRRRIQETVTAIETLQPKVVVTIDSPGFNFRVGKGLKKRNPSIPLAHYVAPSVWAWRPKRAHKIAQFLDLLLVLFPFEPPYFLKEGLETQFVGHPVGELGLEKISDATFRARHGIPPHAPLLTVLPGSRRGEIARLLPIFQETIQRLRQKHPDLQVVIPTLPHLKDQIRQQLTISATLVTTPSEKFAAYRESRAALAASGTVSLELAAAGLPMVITYQIHPLTYFVIKHLVNVKHACLVNLLMNQGIVTERLQDDCTPQNLELDLGALLEDSDKRQEMITQMQEAVKRLASPDSQKDPSQCAAASIRKFLDAHSHKTSQMLTPKSNR